MKKIKIFTDSCCDLGHDIRAQYDIDYVKMLTIEDGNELPADLDFPAYTPKEMYDKMRAGKRITTAQVPVIEFTNRFTEALEAGYDIIYIGCALPLSSSVNTGMMVARDLMQKYEGAKIFCIDATNSCLGEGLLAVYAAILRDEEKSIEEIANIIEEKKHTVNQFVTVGSLDMLKKSGRVKGSAAFFGNLFGVKPVIISDYNGQNVPICKVKGRQASIDKLVELTKETAVDPANETVFIGHADCAEDAEYLRCKLIEEVGFKDAYVNFIGPIIGACIGPDAIGAFFFGKKVETSI